MQLGEDQNSPQSGIRPISSAIRSLQTRGVDVSLATFLRSSATNMAGDNAEKSDSPSEETPAPSPDEQEEISFHEP